MFVSVRPEPASVVDAVKKSTWVTKYHSVLLFLGFSLRENIGCLDW